MKKRKIKDWYAGLPKEVFGLEWFRIWGIGETFCYFYLEEKIFTPAYTEGAVNAIVKYLQKKNYSLTLVDGILKLLEEDESKNIYPRDPAALSIYALTKIALKRYRYLMTNEEAKCAGKCTGKCGQKCSRK